MKRIYLLLTLSLLSQLGFATNITPTTGYENGHEWVDLGLPSGTLWATCNVGASSPEEYGDYFAWGETSAKADFAWETYSFYTSGTFKNDSQNDLVFSKYNTTNKDHGPVDKKKQLDLSDDTARAVWGGTWRIPTKDQWDELRNQCSWSWTGSGINVKGPNGQSINLPAAGFRNGGDLLRVGSVGVYWSSCLESPYPWYAWNIHFDDARHGLYIDHRYKGYSVRPVIENIGEQSASARSSAEQSISGQEQQQDLHQSSDPTTGYDNGHEWVDLGLSSGTLWATCNVGASGSNEYGDYFAWGETTAKSVYNAKTHKYCVNGNSSHYTKYVPLNHPECWSGNGRVDNKTVLDLSDDAAHVNWGGGWKTPTMTQWKELKLKCMWSWTGSGYKVTGPNGQSIFLPAAGLKQGSSSNFVGSNGYYWSSYLVALNHNFARSFSISSDGSRTPNSSRFSGLSVRPVKESIKEKPTSAPQISGIHTTGVENGHEWVDLGLPSRVKWATCNLGANYPDEFGDYYAWGETTTKSEYSFRTMKYGVGIEIDYFNKYVPLDKSNFWFGDNDPDNLIRLELSDDAARANWGGKWRIPSKDQWEELIEHCEWSWVNSGYEVIGPNGQKLFLPLSGHVYKDYKNYPLSLYHGYYWSSSLDGFFPAFAWGVHFDDKGKRMKDSFRSTGLPIRPLLETSEEQSIAIQQLPPQQNKQQEEKPSGTSTTGYEKGHEWVDLGLPSGTKWATCNVGASSPTGDGNNYAWAETNKKLKYTWSSLKYCTEIENKVYFKKYVSSDKTGFWSGHGRPDNKTRLDNSDDAARANWGGKWHIPTTEQWAELRNLCIWSWTGSGIKIVGPNGQSIILPAAGYRSESRNDYPVYASEVGTCGYYWSSSLDIDKPSRALILFFNKDRHSISLGYRYYGNSIRPVID